MAADYRAFFPGGKKLPQIQQFYRPLLDTGYCLDTNLRLRRLSPLSIYLSLKSISVRKRLSDFNSRVIETVVDCKGQFISSFFVIKKSSRGWRFILNLKRLNMFIIAPHFKLED